MKILMINVVCGIRSTGRICTDLAVELEKQGHEVKIAYGRETVPERFQKYAIRVGNDLDVKLHAIKARLFDGLGFGSKLVTMRFIKWIESYDPDVIHLHNIHGYYINIEVLFDYLKKCGKKIVWTLHDCWSFTGHCAYFDYVNCQKWKKGCNGCTQKTEYPARIGLDMSKRNYNKKREIFTKVKNMTLVTPSKWLSDLVAESYLAEYPKVVIYNGVDTNEFKPTNNNVREKYYCHNKKIVLGVASVWDKRKGLDTFIKLSKHLDDSYQIILVGLNKQQISTLPNNIIGLEGTNNVRELAELYTAADVFVNPTLEDNYPTTNIEAIACGTPVITFNTGGSPESAMLLGKSVEKHDFEALVKEICSDDEFVFSENHYLDYQSAVYEYISLYNNLEIRER